MGFVYALITSVFFTAYTIPKKISKQNTACYSMFQGMGYYLASAAAYLVHILLRGDGAEQINDSRLIISALTGVIWFTGCVFFFMAIDEMGLSRSNQWKNLQGPFGAVFNLLFLAEYQQTNVLFIVLSCAAILISAMLLTVRAGSEKAVSKKGIVYSLLAAVFFGLNSMFLKIGTNNGFIFSQQLVIAGAVFFSSIVYILIKERGLPSVRSVPVKDNLLGILGGALFCAASLFSLRAYALLPGSVTFTIIQLNAVWTVLAGVFIFREINFKSNWLRIVMGMVFAVVGVVMLLWA